MLALAARRSITLYKRGNCSRETGCAPLEASAILSEKKYAAKFITTAIPSAICMPPRPAIAPPATTSTTVRAIAGRGGMQIRSEEHTSELQSLRHLVCRLLLEKKKRIAEH